MILIDINECAINNGGCEHVCTNYVGNYTCSCNSGYALLHKKFCSGIIKIIINDNNTFLKDINECSVNNGDCQQTCHNTAGSYYCQCSTGYTLDHNNCTGDYKQ